MSLPEIKRKHYYHMVKTSFLQFYTIVGYPGYELKFDGYRSKNNWTALKDGHGSLGDYPSKEAALGIIISDSQEEP